MRRLRAMVNIHAAAPVLVGSNSVAFDQTASKASCASSSALCALAPDRSMNVLMRGAKCANSAAKASRSCRSATASINAAHLAASKAAPSGVSFGMRRERPRMKFVPPREYRIAAALTRAPTPKLCMGLFVAVRCMSGKRRIAAIGSLAVIQNGGAFVSFNGSRNSAVGRGTRGLECASR